MDVVGAPPTPLVDVDGVVLEGAVTVVLVEGEVVVEDRSGAVVVVSEVEGVVEVEVGTVEGTVVVGLPPPQKNVHDPPVFEPPTVRDRDCPVPSSISVTARAASTKTTATVAARMGQLTPKVRLAHPGCFVGGASWTRAAVPPRAGGPGVVPST